MIKRNIIKFTTIVSMVVATNLLDCSKSLATAKFNEEKKEHSVQEVITEWNKLKPEYNGDIFVEQPSTSYPYKIGKVDDAYLKDTLNYLNFVRYLAYLNSVELDSNLTRQAQYGAVLTAANKRLEHNSPLHPKDMSNDFYNIGKASTSSSNLSNSELLESIKICLNDNRNIQGIDDVGHREWLLEPTLTKIGFGTALNYSVHNLPFGNFSKNVKIPDYIEWPAQGAFPSEFINRSAMWSINLNRNVYKLDNINNIVIKITRISDNKEWTLHKVEQLSTSISGFKLSKNSNHGNGSSTLVFHIGNSELQDVNYMGRYKIEISGLEGTDNSGKSIDYAINFFELDNETNLN